MYRSLNDELREKFGEKVYKLALDGGFSCPHRDKNNQGGCIFCSQGGSGEFAQKKLLTIDEQIDKAIKLVESKKPKKFIAYFQSFTNTYGPIEKLEETFYPAINHPKISALSIATRPDCLSLQVVELLDKLNQIKPLFIELGLQTSNEEVAKFINRGYENEVYLNAVKKLKEINVNVITHLIIGLPNCSLQDEIASLNFAINAKTDGIKLQLLHVLKDTKLAQIYLNNGFKTLEMNEYISRLIELVKLVPQKVVIHRLTGDAPKKLLISPKWSADKKVVLNAINKAFKENHIKLKEN